jgi:hypothetical protein
VTDNRHTTEAVCRLSTTPRRFTIRATAVAEPLVAP